MGAISLLLWTAFNTEPQRNHSRAISAAFHLIPSMIQASWQTINFKQVCARMCWILF